MAKLIRYQLGDILGQLPAIVPLNVEELSKGVPEDLFLCALGFEPRCLTLPSRLENAGYKAKVARYFKYGTNLKDNAANLRDLERNLERMATDVSPIEADTPDLPERFREVLEVVTNGVKDSAPSVTLDVSVTANRLLLRCIKVLLEYNVQLRIVYSEAEIYHPTKEAYEGEAARWAKEEGAGLERGVGEVMASIDHSGDALDGLPDSVILIPSLKADRSKAVVSFVDPSLLQSLGDRVIWLVGVPHLEKDKWRLEAMKRINGIDEDTRHFEVSTFDYKETLQCLENLHAELADGSTLTLSPLGSKMQALGAALFCYMHRDVRVVLASPKEYNAEQYSKGCKAVWKVDFGHLKELQDILDRVGTLRIED